MNFKNEKFQEEKINSDKTKMLQKFLNKNNYTKNKQNNMKIYDPIIINNNNLIKFINSTNTPINNNMPTPFINNNFNVINTPSLKNKIELKLYPETDIKKISFNKNLFPQKIYKNESDDNALIKNISDNNFEINNNNYINNAPNTAKKYTIYTKEDKSDLNDNIINFNNHKYLYINNSKEKNKNKKYKIGKTIKNNDYIDESDNKNQNNNNIYLNSDNINNMNYVNTLNDRTEKLRETLQNINVYDIISEEVGLQSNKYREFNDNDCYEKAKKLNKQFYDNLDINLNEIENILNNL